MDTRTLPMHARLLLDDLGRPQQTAIQLESGAIVLGPPRPLSRGAIARKAEAWYEWARLDWRPAAAFRRLVDAELARIAKERPDLHERAVSIVRALEAEIRELAARDTRPPTRTSSATLALSACLGAWGDRSPGSSSARNGGRKGHGQIHDGRNPVPRDARSRQRDAQRGREVGRRAVAQ